MAEDEEDPFAHLTTNCHVTSPQLPLLHRSAAFFRHLDRYPSDHSPPPYSTVIRLESPPEDEEFLTPQEDSLPAVDLGRGSESTVVIEWGGREEGGSGGDVGGFKVVGRRAGFKRVRVSEEGLGEAVDLGADEVFDEMFVREQEVEKMDVGEDVGTEVVDLDGKETCGGGFFMRKGGVERRPNENLSKKGVDLGENRRIRDLCMRSGGVEKGFNEDASTEVVDLGENETCVDLCMGNGRVEKGPDEDVSMEDVDLGENEMCGDLCMRNGEVEKEPNENVSKEVGGLPMGNVVGEVGTNGGNEVRRDEFRGFYENGIGEIDNRKFVVSKNDENQQKNEGTGGWRGLYDDLSKKGEKIEKLLRKVDEPCREESRGSKEKGIEENDRFQRVGEENDKFRQNGKCVGGSRKLCNDLPRRNPSRDGIRGFVKENDFQKGDNIHQKGKGPAQARKLPSSLDMLADIALGDASPRERNGGFVEKNRHKSNNSERVGGSRELPSSVGGQTKNSTDQTKNNQIMKNLLDALGLVTGGEKEKVDDGSDEEFDFLETAMIQGIVFPRPRWWPSEGFDDD